MTATDRSILPKTFQLLPSIALIKLCCHYTGRTDLLVTFVSYLSYNELPQLQYHFHNTHLVRPGGERGIHPRSLYKYSWVSRNWPHDHQVPDQHSERYTILHLYFLTSPTKLDHQIILNPCMIRKRQRKRDQADADVQSPVPPCQVSFP